MIRLIGLRWKHGNVCSREVLIVRGLALCVVFVRRQIRAHALLAQPATPAKADRQFMRIGALLLSVIPGSGRWLYPSARALPDVVMTRQLPVRDTLLDRPVTWLGTW